MVGPEYRDAARRGRRDLRGTGSGREERFFVTEVLTEAVARAVPLPDPRRELRSHLARATELIEQRARREGAFRVAEDALHDHDADDPPLGDEAVLEERPLLVPSEHTRLDLERLERLQITAELRECVSHDRQREVPSRDSHRAAPDHLVE